MEVHIGQFGDRHGTHGHRTLRDLVDEEKLLLHAECRDRVHVVVLFLLPVAAYWNALWMSVSVAVVVTSRRVSPAVKR
jgi:hypothetical protein